MYSHRWHACAHVAYQTAIRQEVAAANSVDDIIHGHPTFINVAVHYLRPKQTTYIRDALQGVIREVVNADDLDLETDPTVVSGNSLQSA